MESTGQAGSRPKASTQQNLRQLRVGTAGWSYRDWEGIFYPSGMRQRKIHPLEYLGRFFDTAEINDSFDEPLRPELAKLWCRRVATVNSKFLFTAKLYRAFTHSPTTVVGPTSAATIRPTDEDEARTREGLDALASEGRLGALVINFPLSFKNTSLNREYLDRLLRQFIEYPRVVEVRESSWNNAETLAAFAQKNVGFCNILPPAPERLLIPAPIPAPAVSYIRLNGRDYSEWLDSEDRHDRNHYLYKPKELEAWKEHIEAVRSSPATYVIAGNHVEGKAPVNALELKAILSGKRVAAPPTLIEKYPELRRFADAADDLDAGASERLSFPA